MYNPLDTIRKFQSRLGKPIRPVIEFQKGKIISITTNTTQDGNMISDTFRADAWELHPGDEAHAIYIDGLFKGMGYVAGEEGAILQVRKVVDSEEVVRNADGTIVHNEDGTEKKKKVLTISYKGIFGRWLDAALIERGSALKPNMTQTLVYCGFTAISFFLMGMVYH